jgi:hypothetical protein
MNSNFNNSKNNRGGNSIGTWLFTFNYQGAEGFFKFFVQACTVGAVIVAMKGVQGEYCTGQFVPWMPQTWISPIACWAGGMTRTVPNDFLDQNTRDDSAGAGNAIVQPPALVSPSPASNYTPQQRSSVDSAVPNPDRR